MDGEDSANVNPLDTGNDATSVESAASAFTDMISSDEHGERRRAQPSGNGQGTNPKQRGGQRETADTDDDTDDGDSGNASADDDIDPVLDAPAEPGDDENGDEEGDDTDDADEGEEGDDTNDENDGADDEDGELDLSRTVEVTVNGQSQELPLSEVIAGYSRDADYRQKTQRLAEERRQVVDFAQNLDQQHRALQQSAQQYEDMVEALRPSQADWDALKQQSPNDYIAAKERWDEVDRKVAQAKQDREQSNTESQRNNQQVNQATVQQETNKLLQAYPALNNDKVADDFRGTIMSYAKKAGYDEAEIRDGLFDHRDIITMYKAAKFDEMKANRAKARKPKKAGTSAEKSRSPKTSNSSRPRSITRSKKNGKGLKEANERLRKSGSQQDAAAAFTEMLNG